MQKDIYGKGLLAYLNGDECAFFTVESDVAETEEWNVNLFFREYTDMPETEKIALQHASGAILDVGAGAGKPFNLASKYEKKGYCIGHFRRCGGSDCEGVA